MEKGVTWDHLHVTHNVSKISYLGTGWYWKVQFPFYFARTDHREGVITVYSMVLWRPLEYDIMLPFIKSWASVHREWHWRKCSSSEKKSLMHLGNLPILYHFHSEFKKWNYFLIWNRCFYHTFIIKSSAVLSSYVLSIKTQVFIYSTPQVGAPQGAQL